MEARFVGLALFALCLSYVASSAGDLPWYGREYQQCNDGSTQAIVECVDELVKKWDGRLNSAYKKLMDSETGDQRDRLRTAQRLWVQFRDANCDYYAFGEGTISRIESVECMRMLTKERAEELEQALTP
jgi:uncharacterized protein YecT (DUF1311 family)